MNAPDLARRLTKLDDDALMAMIREASSDAALRVLYDRHGPEVHRVTRRILRDPARAADAAQEVLAKIYLKRHRYTSGTNFRAWILGVARNHALTALRSMRRHPTSARSGAADGELEALPAPTQPGSTSAAAAELTAAYSAAVNELPDRYRRVFEMCVQEQRPYREVSAELGLPKGTVAIRIHRARQRIFGQLASFLDADHVASIGHQYVVA